MSEFDNYQVRMIKAADARKFVCEHHYSHGCHNGPMASIGLYDNQTLIGVCLFSTPCSENVRASVFGPEHKDHVTELSRLVILDGTPRNTESWFVSRCMHIVKAFHPKIWAVLSFADPTVGHVGTIYQALNFMYTGRSTSTIFYRDGTGRIRHPRQCGKNINAKTASEMGWQPFKSQGKFRYLLFLADNRRHRMMLQKLCRLRSDIMYPKKTEAEL